MNEKGQTIEANYKTTQVFSVYTTSVTSDFLNLNNALTALHSIHSNTDDVVNELERSGMTNHTFNFVPM